MTFHSERTGPWAQLTLRSWNALGALFARGDVGFAEAYLDESWDTSDLSALLTLAASNRTVLDSAIYGTWWGVLLYRFRRLSRANTRAGARRNISAHYDLGNNFYAAWLDSTMTYSSALFEGQPDRGLHDAQLAKYERVLRQIGAAPGEKILELGSGWGGFAEYAARTRGCHVHGISLSAEQLNYSSKRARELDLANQCSFSRTDYRDVSGQFDHVVSIEMFEAVGERYWPDFFRAVKRCLAPRGKALIQTITIDDALFERYRDGTDFIQQYVFPGGMLASKGEFLRHARQAGLKAQNPFCFGQDYAESLRRWLSRYADAAPALRELGFDARFERLWRFYLAYSIAGFATGNTDVVQFELTHA